MSNKWALGIKAKDKITGFTGTVIGVTEYLTGCRQYLVQPPTKPDGDYGSGVWLDEDRLEAIEGEKINLEVKRAGCCQPAPRK